MANYDVAMLNSRIAELLAEFPELHDDEELLADTLDGETEIKPVVNRLLGKVLNDEALIEGIADSVRVLNDRKKRFERRINFNRELVKHILENSGLKKLEVPLGTASIRATPPSVLVLDDTIIPDEYLRIKKEVNKSAIKAALENGKAIDGAVLSNGGSTLSVRF